MDEEGDSALGPPLRISSWASDIGLGALSNLDPVPVSKEAVARWSEHVKTLSDEQRQTFLRAVPDMALAKYADAVDGIIDKKIKASKLVRATHWVQPLLDFIELCRPLVDSLGDIYPPAGAILGGIYFALDTTKRAVEYQDSLVQFLAKVTSSLGQLEKFKKAFPDTPEFQTALVDVFDIILQICVRASTLNVDSKGKERSSARLFRRSFAKDFGEWERLLDTSLRTFDRTVHLISGQKIGNVQQTQLIQLRIQLDTYKAVRKNETSREQEERERHKGQIEREQDEKRKSLLIWLSSLSFQSTHNSILATTLDETGKWLLSHEAYLLWKERVSGSLLWVYGKHGSGKSHLAARVIEELRLFCQERNLVASSQEGNRRDDDVLYETDLSQEGPPSPGPIEPAGNALVLYSETHQPDTTARNSPRNTDRPYGMISRNNPSVMSETLEQRNRFALAYVYCSSQLIRRSGDIEAGHGATSKTGYDTTGLLSSLLKQLYQFLPKNEDVAALRDLCFVTKADQPSRHDIMKGIKSVIPMFTQAFIVVDGLDECSGVASLEFEGLCDYLASLADLGGTNSSANVLVFSRPGYQAISSALHACPNIQVDQGANDEDISRFIEDRSKELRKVSASLEVIQSHLLDAADGMFLWVSLVIDSIKKERTAKKMKAAARNMPRGLSGAYTDALKRIISNEPSARDLALKALLWATNCKRPLSKAQLLEALAIEDGMTAIEDDDRIYDSVPLTTDCSDLLVLKDGHYMLLHPSLGDFLKGLSDDDAEGLQLYGDLQKRASRILVEACLTYLKFGAFTAGPEPTKASFDELMEQHPFLSYAGAFWGDHLREVLEEDHDPELRKSACDLLRSQNAHGLLHQIHIKSYVQGNPTICPFPPGTAPLHLLSIFGLHRLLEALTPEEVDIDQSDGFGNFAVDYAADFGRKDMCSWIVNKHKGRLEGGSLEDQKRCVNSRQWLIGAVIRHHWADILSTLLELGHSTAGALHTAARFDHTETVEKLLLFGAKINARDGNGCTPLIVAAQFKHIGIVKTLLQHGADVSCCGDDGITALHYVAVLVDDGAEIAEELLNKGADIEATWASRTPLHEAARAGSEKTVTVLLDHGANKEAKTDAGQTPLLLCAKEGSPDVARVLLRKGANITAITANSITSLHYAARRTSVEIFSLLLQSPLAKKLVNHTDSEMYTPLSDAAYFGRTDCATRLLDEGADVNLANRQGRTPMLIALRKGHFSLAQMFVDVYKANPKHTDREDATGMHMIAKCGQAEHIETLLSWGIEAFAPDDYGMTALYYAVESNDVRFVESFVKTVPAEELFEEGQDQNCLLHLASERGYDEIVKCLLEWCPELGLSEDPDGELAIHRAAKAGHVECIKHLCNPDVINRPGRNENGQTALHYAVIEDNLTLVQYLLEHGANVNGGDQSNELLDSPLIKALEKRSEDICNALLDKGADLEAADEEKWRPLHFAAYQGRLSLARRLVDSGCELEPLSDEGKTPFYYALDGNHSEMIQFLWDRGLQDLTVQSSSAGWTYAHIAAQRGRFDILRKLSEKDKSVLLKTDLFGEDPLGLAAESGEYFIVEFLIRSGLPPDGLQNSKATPLISAARAGNFRTVTTLLEHGAAVNKTDEFLRTALSWAITSKKLKIAHELLKAGANPHLRDAMGLSAFDLAVGVPSMMALLSPWNHTFHSSPEDYEDRAYTLVRFISRTATALASESKLLIERKPMYEAIFRQPRLYLLIEALTRLALLPLRQSHLVPESTRPSNSRDARTAVPVLRAEVFREWKFLCADTSVDLECDFCCSDIEDEYYVCSICFTGCCKSCYLPLDREYFQPLQLLRRLEKDLISVLGALKDLAHRDSRILGKVLCQNNMLQGWTSLKKQEYATWNLGTSFAHFQETDFVGWEAIQIIDRIMALSLHPDSDLETFDTDASHSQNSKDDWGDLTKKWQDIYAYSNVDGPHCIPLPHCTHDSFIKVMPKAEVSKDDHIILDSDGRISTEVFDLLAKKYENAVNSGSLDVEALRSTRFSEPLAEYKTKGALQSLFSFEPTTVNAIAAGEDRADGAPGSSWDSDGQGSSDGSDSSKGSDIDSSLPSSDDSVLPTRSQSGDRVDIEIEEILENLLETRGQLVKKDALTDEDDLVLETAWKMAQAIVYHATPRPPLRDIVDQYVGYSTAPGTPNSSAPSSNDGSNRASSYGTARSASAASWITEYVRTWSI